MTPMPKAALTSETSVDGWSVRYATLSSRLRLLPRAQVETATVFAARRSGCRSALVPRGRGRRRAFWEVSGSSSRITATIDSRQSAFVVRSMIADRRLQRPETDVNCGRSSNAASSDAALPSRISMDIRRMARIEAGEHRGRKAELTLGSSRRPGAVARPERRASSFDAVLQCVEGVRAWSAKMRARLGQRSRPHPAFEECKTKELFKRGDVRAYPRLERWTCSSPRRTRLAPPPQGSS